MNFLTAQTISRGPWLKASLVIFSLGLGWSISHAQLTNGVFDPSKVMVATEKVKDLQTFRQNIELTNEFNRTLGTPQHPRPHLATPPPGSGGPGEPSYGPPQVPSFEDPLNGKKRRGLRRKNQPSPFTSSPDAPFAEANKVGPTVEASPVEPMVEAVPLPDNPDRINPPSLDSSDFEPTPAGIPGTDVPMDPSLLLDDNPDGNGLLTEGGILLPSNSSSPEGGRRSSIDSSRAGFLRKLGKGKSRRVLDTPERSIPISIGSNGNTGNPYSDDTFVASSGYSPLLDGGNDLSTIRDMTASGSRPVPSGATGIAERGSRKAEADTSQYYVVKKDGLLFEPFKNGTEEADPDYAFELYSGGIVRDLGLIGSKRKIQVDSGDTGLVSKDGIRSLSVTEQSTMSIGIKTGKPWYSILDTDPEL